MIEKTRWQLNKEIVLILSKDLQDKGGVANYYRIFLKRFRDKKFQLKLFTIGSRAKNDTSRRKIHYILTCLADFIKLFFLLLADNKIKIIQINPSLIPIPLIRDGVLLYIGAFFRKKIITIFHGWKKDIETILRENGLYRTLFKLTYLKSDRIIVLANDFKKALIEFGFKSEKIKNSTASLLVPKP